MKRLTRWEEFWPWYLQEHSNPRNQAMHVLGLAANLSVTTFAVASGHWALLLLGPLAGYSLAWTGHLAFQRNVPASVRYPYWSLRAELKMVWQLASQVLNNYRRSRNAPSTASGGK